MAASLDRAGQRQRDASANVWILVSTSAGICEEFVYRGYLQQQFAALTRSATGGLVLQAIAFGVSHA
jgi:uncharacterized protein